jgi:hypothetical protein
MSDLRKFAAQILRLPADMSGQTIVAYAIVTCLLAAALVVGASIWTHGSVVPDYRPAVEPSR